MNITVKKLAELHKPAHNIRRHSDKQITEYIRSIEMFGQVKPLVVAEDGEIIAGNGLYEALLRCREQGVEVSLATLRAFVSEEALNELSRLAAQYSDVNCTPEDIKLYLERIARGTPVASRAASMSTNDIEQYLQSMREQKQGTADAEDSV